MRRKLWWAGGVVLLGGLLATPALADTRGFDPVAATEAYLASVPPEAKARSDAYFEGGYWLQLWEPLYGLVVAWVLLNFRLSARMRDLGQRLGGRGFLGTVLYTVQYVVLVGLLSFPLTLYTGFAREHHYGLSTQGFGDWFGQLLIGLGVSLVMVSLAMGVLYTVIRAAPRRWWVGGTGVGVGFLVVALVIGPVFIAPLFNDYKPLEPGPVRDKVLSMARANGVPADEVYMFDASRQSKRISANVSGILGTQRISLNDNLLNRSTPEEIEMVMAHELGHYVLNHVYEMLLSFALVLLVGLAFVAWAFPRVLARWGTGWGVADVGDAAGLPLLSVLLSLYMLAATPVLNTIVRSNEAEADLFGLNASGQPDGFATVALKLGEYRKLDPSPLEEFLLFDHPSGRSRILMGMRWKAEHLSSP